MKKMTVPLAYDPVKIYRCVMWQYIPLANEYQLILQKTTEKCPANATTHKKDKTQLGPQYREQVALFI